MKTRYTQPKMTTIKGKQLQGTHIPAMLAERRNDSGNRKNISNHKRNNENSNDKDPNKKWVYWFFIILMLASGVMLLRNRGKNVSGEMNDSTQSDLKGGASIPTSLSVSDHIPEILADIQEQIKLNTTNDLCQMPAANILCKGNLGISRDQMPQLNDDILENYLDQAQQNGIVVKSLTVPARNLIPTQSQLHAASIFSKHLQAKENASSNPCKKNILVASDPVTGVLHIIDGHHTGMGCLLAEGEQQIKLISQSARKTLDDLKSYAGVETSALPFFVNTAKERVTQDGDEVHSVSRVQRKH